MSANVFETIGFRERPSSNEILATDVTRYAKALEERGVPRLTIEQSLSLHPPAYAFDALVEAEQQHTYAEKIAGFNQC